MSFIEMGVISTGISEKKNSSSHAASSLFKFRSSGLPSALSSSIDLVVEGVIGRGVSSVVKLARYEPEIASSSSNDNNDKDEKASHCCCFGISMLILLLGCCKIGIVTHFQTRCIISRKILNYESIGID